MIICTMYLPCAHLKQYVVLLTGSRDKQHTCDVLQVVDRVDQTGPSKCCRQIDRHGVRVTQSELKCSEKVVASFHTILKSWEWDWDCTRLFWEWTWGYSVCIIEKLETGLGLGKAIQCAKMKNWEWARAVMRPFSEHATEKSMMHNITITAACAKEDVQVLCKHCGGSYFLHRRLVFVSSMHARTCPPA